MITYESAAATDTGQVRQANEDSYHVGDAVFAVADGMGGHVAGEVASRTALGPVAELDGKVFPDAQAAVDALREAVLASNRAVAEEARRRPEYRGMGTTLTAAMVEGRRLHLAHVGDSRAYLARGGQFEQITTDHTLVQHLIDEGQITVEEATTHPQRSIITRAIGVAPDVEVDTVTLEIEPGDQLMLCSDGLSGVVDHQTMSREVLERPDADEVVDDLVAEANRRGGPDNITVILLRFEPETVFPPAATTSGGGRGDGTEAGGGTPTSVRGVGTDDRTDDGAWAQQLGRLSAGAAGDEERDGGTTTGQRVAAAAVVVLLVLGAAIGGGRWLLSRSYFVGVADEQVAIYRGVPSTIGPVELHWVEEVTDLEVAELPRFLVNDLEDGRAAVSLADARNIIANYERLAEERRESDPEPTASPTPGTSPSPAPASPTASPTS